MELELFKFLFCFYEVVNLVCLWEEINYGEGEFVVEGLVKVWLVMGVRRGDEGRIMEYCCCSFGCGESISYMVGDSCCY